MIEIASSSSSEVSFSITSLPAKGSTKFLIPDSYAITCCVLSASLADWLVGKAKASSKAFVCND